MGIGAIPRSKMRDYALEHGIDDPDEFDRFRSIIGAMDDEYQVMANKASDKKENVVPVSDVAGLRKLFSKVESRANAAHGKKRKK
jgi:hypothetical protein